MTRKTAIFLTCAALAVACGRSQTARRNDQNYQVVEEGQASGVTSTINAPGETTPPLTDTAVDTTTNFTLPDNPAPLGTQPNSVAGSFPAYPPSTVPQPRVQQPPMASGTAPPPKQKPEQPPTDTTATQAPPPTDTTATQAPPPTDTAKTDTTKTDTALPPPPTPPV